MEMDMPALHHVFETDTFRRVRQSIYLLIFTVRSIPLRAAWERLDVLQGH
jgi:hypothetical protein